jgi:hypothetical protein
MFKKLILIKNCISPFLFCLIFLAQAAFCKSINIDISKGYVDSTFEIADIHYNSQHGLDTIKFSNGLSLRTFYVGCCNAIYLCGRSGIEFLDVPALFYCSIELNDTSWNKANAVPLHTEIGADTIRYCDSISRYPSYILSKVEGQDLSDPRPDYTETAIYSKKILYGCSHGRYFKFQPESWISDTTRTVLNTTQIWIKSMKIKFACDSAGNGKFLLKSTAIITGNQKLSISHQLRINKKLARSGLLFQKTNSVELNMLGKKVVNQKLINKHFF